MKESGAIDGIIRSFALLVLLIMLFLASIVANSLMKSNLEDRSYENAMLRCLGWSSQNIVIMSILRYFLLIMVPGYCIGQYAAYSMSLLTTDLIQGVAKFNFQLPYSNMAIIIGAACAILLPLLSLISPLTKLAQTHLRDAMDVTRKKDDQLTVRFNRFTSMIGVSVTQILMGFMFTMFGVIFFVIIPNKLLAYDL